MTEKINPVSHVFPSELAWEQYTLLEEEFLIFLRYVPLQEEHYNVWSPKLVNLMINTGSTIDSFFKNAISTDSWQKIIRDDQIPYRKDRPDMRLYRTLFNNMYNFSDKRIFNLISGTELYPFSEWKNENALRWWTSYTKLKHDRFENREQAAIKNVLNALGGLFLLNAIHIETRLVLLKEKIIQTEHYIDNQFLIKVLLNIEPLDIPYPIFAKTKLFGYVFELKNKKINESNQRYLLDPWTKDLRLCRIPQQEPETTK